MQLTQGMAIKRGKPSVLNNVNAMPTSVLPQLCRVGIATLLVVKLMTKENDPWKRTLGISNTDGMLTMD